MASLGEVSQLLCKIHVAIPKHPSSVSGWPPWAAPYQYLPGAMPGYKPHPLAALKKIIPNLETAKAHCPSDPCVGIYSLKGALHSLSDVIQHLNDYHEWTREDIADWLETLDTDLSVKPIDKDTNDAQKRYPIHGDELAKQYAKLIDFNLPALSEANIQKFIEGFKKGYAGGTDGGDGGAT